MTLSLPQHLSEVLDTRYFDYLKENYYWVDPSQRYEALHCEYGKLILLLIHFIMNLRSDVGRVMDLVKGLDDSAKLHLSINYSGYFSDFCETLMSTMDEFQAFFTIENPTAELLANFIDFLVGISHVIMHHRPNIIVHVKDLIKDLHKELKFLLAFLGDKPLELTENKCLLTDIEAVANEVASFLFAFILRPISTAAGMGLAISDFLQKIEQLKMKIKDHCAIHRGGFHTKMSLNSIYGVNSLLDDLMELMDHEVNWTSSVIKDQIKTIHDDLLYFRSFFHAIEMQQNPPEDHQQVLVQISDFAYEVECIVNSYSHAWYLEIRLSHAMEKAKPIRMAVEEIKMNHETGLLQVADHLSEKLTTLAAERSVISDEIMVGFQDETRKIREQLRGGAEQLQIISIFGMSGLGKTTLAKKLYNDPSIVSHFDKRAWCVISQTYQKRNTLVDILRSLGDFKRDAIQNMDEGSLALEIHKTLKGWRYLIVIDDIWKVDDWKDLKRYFQDDRSGSRILFTTRIKELGLQASSHSLINELPFLSNDECWDLLQRKVFKKEHCPQELKEIGTQIATNCHGLPLAVVVIAAVLAKMEKKKSSWKKIATSLSSHIYEDPSKCMNILELSYKNLPMHLKPCFLYFGVFPEDKEVPVRKLISLWIAEGFIEKKNNKNLEIVAEEYIMDLIDRSLLIVSKRRSDGGVKACNIHDLLHDMCLRIAEEENFLRLIKNQASLYDEQHSCYRLSIRSSLSSKAPYGHHLCSMFYHLRYPSLFILWSLKSLKIWDLSVVDLKHYESILEIKLPVNLRYLAVPCTLPSINSLKKLEFLYVENKEPVRISFVLLTMASLKHLHFSQKVEFSEHCRLQAKDESFPQNNLESISFLFISDEEDEKILKCSPNLRKLKCSFTSFVGSGTYIFRYPDFSTFQYLESLNVSIQRTYYADDSKPGFTSFPPNLKKLTLRDFDLHWEEMRIMGILSKLEVLKLRNCNIEQRQWDTYEDEFQELRFLELDGVQIARWNASTDHFPKLERLVLRKCNHLKKIPSDLGYILTLHVIEVHACKKSVGDSAMQIEKEQRDNGNEELTVIISHSQLLRRRLENLQKQFGRPLETIL